ncbi:MAG TPA: polyprenyl diphosphate synthase, partial [Patescibacteria group bacterium]
MIQHVAFIMDGNRRWARARKLPLLAGHTKGYQAIEPLIDFAHQQGIKYLTFWAFSTENWNRDKKEVDVLLKIFRHIFQGSLIKRLKKNGVKVNILGEIEAFPQDIAEKVKQLVEE